MFWKRKPAKGISGHLSIEFDQDRRSYYRVESSHDRPVFFEVKGRRLPVDDVSAGGMSMHTGNVTVGMRLPGKLILPGLPEPVEATFEVVAVNNQGVARGPFVEISDRERERLHYYVLQRQKEEIEMRRKHVTGHAEGPKPQ